MVYTVYIIGEISDRITICCREKFKKAQLFLEEKRFNVINPVEIIDNNKIESENINQKKIRALLQCNAVYILPCVTIEKTQNAELLLALKLNVLLIHHAFQLNDNEWDPLVINEPSMDEALSISSI
jgi:hypothetical protein